MWGRLPARLQGIVANRRLDGFPSDAIRLHVLSELVALGRIRRGADHQTTFHRRNGEFQKAIQISELERADVVVGFDTSAWILTERCRDLGIPLILDQTTSHPDSKTRIFEQMRMSEPSWTERVELRDSKVRAAEQREHEGATIVVVASSFARRTLIENGVSESKIRVNALGVDCERFASATNCVNRPFRFVFVGIISARKGVRLLLEAWRYLKPRAGELWLVGHAERHVLSGIPDVAGLRYLGPKPHAEIPGILKQCDVLVFPSYFEGFGLVILEAMACGIPVITTSATAGPDIYSDGEGGWITPPGDVVELTRVMRGCLENRAGVVEAGRMARGIAEGFSWTAYGNRWMRILEDARAI